jgi:putative endonuclease
MRKNDYYVYMLLCSDGSYYTGVTNDYERRFAEHRDGIVSGCYTFKRRPLKLVYVSHFHNVLEAIAWEKRVKRWRREKKEALIKREWEKLPELSKKDFKKYKLRKGLSH